jgi:hypothetical protein
MRKKGWLLLAFLATVLGNVMKMDLKDNAVAYRPMQKTPNYYNRLFAYTVSYSKEASVHTSAHQQA